MEVAVIEKNKSAGRLYNDLFDFQYDLHALTGKKTGRVLKADLDLTKEDVDHYDYVICVGAEPAKHIAKITNITKYSGELIDNKYIPLINPAAIRFRPELRDTFDVGLKKLKQHIAGTYEEDLGIYHSITTTKDLKDLLHTILDEAVEVAIDTETTALYPRDGYVFALVLSYKEGEGYVIDADAIDDVCIALLQNIINTKKIIFHHAKFDIKMLQYHFGLKFGDFDDTMLEHYILNENEAHDLKSLIIKYTKMGDFDRALDQFKREYCRKHGILLKDFIYSWVPWDTMVEYGGGDGDGTLRLHHKFKPVVEKHFDQLYNTIMIPGTKFLIDIEETGVPFSREKLEEARVDMDNRIYTLRQDFYQFDEVKQVENKLNVVFNPNSTTHLRSLFFDILGLKSVKKTPKGEPSTDKEVLAILAEKHDAVKLVSELRGLVKMKSTYIDKVLAGLDRDSRLRTGFHLHTVTSGRLSSSGKLNMQQLPRDDKTVKGCIVPIVDGEPNDDWVIFSQDLATAEMYYAAVLSGDKNLMDVFRSGGDFHSSIAQKVFKLGCDVGEIADKYRGLRQASKAISFGILYGAGPHKVATTANITMIEAKEAIDDYFGTFPQLKRWIDTCTHEIATKGCTYSHFGRKRRVQNVFSAADDEVGHAIRSAFNFKVQSVASDVNLLGAIDNHDWIKQNNFPAEIFGLVHDSILGQVKKDALEEFQERLGRDVQRDRGCSIPGFPIGVDFGSGESYAKAG